MTLSIHRTNDWSPEQFAPYGAAVTAAMHKLEEQFPLEVDVQHLAREIMSGKRDLWLVLDGEEFVSFVLTEIHIEEATGLKTMVVPSGAGDDGLKAVPLIAAIEEHAKQNGCDAVIIYGRLGWKKAIAKQGYGLEAAIYKKAM